MPERNRRAATKFDCDAHTLVITERKPLSQDLVTYDITGSRETLAEQVRKICKVGNVIKIEGADTEFVEGIRRKICKVNGRRLGTTHTEAELEVIQERLRTQSVMLLDRSSAPTGGGDAMMRARHAEYNL